MDMPVKPLLYRFIGEMILLTPTANRKFPPMTSAILYRRCFLFSGVSNLLPSFIYLFPVFECRTGSVCLDLLPVFTVEVRNILVEHSQ